LVAKCSGSPIKEAANNIIKNFMTASF